VTVTNGIWVFAANVYDNASSQWLANNTAYFYDPVTAQWSAYDFSIASAILSGLNAIQVVDGVSYFTAVDTSTGASTSAVYDWLLPTGTMPVITAGSLPAGTVSVPYSQSISVSGGNAPYSWSVVSNGLPPGLTLTTSGVITGTPTVALTASFLVNVTDAYNLTTQSNLSLTVNGLICTYVLSATGTNVTGGTCTGQFSVAVDLGCTWSAIANNSWLHTTSSGDGAGAVSYLVDANPSLMTQTGTVSVAGQTFTVIQAGDSVGDGILDSWRQAYFGGTGGSTNAVSCATCDPDGDGQDNLAEFLAGTDPTNSLSCFHVISVVPQGAGVLITWLGGGGRTNQVQAGTGVSTNSYFNLSPLIIIPGGSPIITNYLDAGGLTNIPARFYRIQLVP
jgi:hypothetical protein